ncbi:MAG: NAD-dependent epimerase/dehydratase family protein [Candidatus Methylomirabilales bacterium]
MGKKILVTGGCGFIGSEVVRQLLDRGYHIRVVDNLSKPNCTVSSEFEFLPLDLTDPTQSNRAFDGMNVCIHLAARIGGIGYFHRYPATILSENNKIYSNIFESAARHNLERLVYVSSSMVFESAEMFPHREEDIHKIAPPLTSYGFSKLTGEWYCRAFFEQHGLRYTILRPFNAFGVNEEPGEEVGDAHVIPDLIRKALTGQRPLEILGDGEQTRCFTHVKDVAKGMILALESEIAVNEDFNLGTSEEIRIVDLAHKIFQLCRPGEGFEIKFTPGFEFDVQRRVPDSSKAHKILNWRPEISLDSGLVEVVQWLKGKIKKKECISWPVL